MNTDSARSGVVAAACLVLALLACSAWNIPDAVAQEQPPRTDGGNATRVRGDRAPTVQRGDTEIASAKERVRTFLRRVSSGKYPGYVKEYVAPRLKLLGGNVVEEFAPDAVDKAIHAALAGPSRQVQVGKISYEDGDVVVAWSWTGGSTQSGTTLLERMYADGAHTAAFRLNTEGLIAEIELR
jgi:hypothetical protein